MKSVVVTSYPEPRLDLAEALRYCGVKDGSDNAARIIEESFALMRDKLGYRVAYKEICVSVDGDTVDLGFARVESQALSRYFAGCDRALLFAASVGREVDRLLRRYSIDKPTRVPFIDAVGSERVESLCDTFCRDMQEKREGERLLNRFSPGYADCPLSMQKDIVSELDLGRTLGITLNDAYLMTPVKSITAIAGILP
jgi:hypothetical protein